MQAPRGRLRSIGAPPSMERGVNLVFDEVNIATNRREHRHEVCFNGLGVCSVWQYATGAVSEVEQEFALVGHELGVLRL